MLFILYISDIWLEKCNLQNLSILLFHTILFLLIHASSIWSAQLLSSINLLTSRDNDAIIYEYLFINPTPRSTPTSFLRLHPARVHPARVHTQPEYTQPEYTHSPRTPSMRILNQTIYTQPEYTQLETIEMVSTMMSTKCTSWPFIGCCCTDAQNAQRPE